MNRICPNCKMDFIEGESKYLIRFEGKEIRAICPICEIPIVDKP